MIGTADLRRLPDRRPIPDAEPSPRCTLLAAQRAADGHRDRRARRCGLRGRRDLVVYNLAHA